MTFAPAAMLGLAALVAVAAAPAAPAPINLVVREETGMLRLSVVGLANAAYSARYTLEVEGQGPGGVNHTRQGGATTLRPGEAATLLSIALGQGDGARWKATLVVTPTDGAPYMQERVSAS